jgi:hypothetical protein
VRSKGGELIPTVDGKPLAGCVHLLCEDGDEGALVQLTFDAGKVYFETESALAPHELH